jgi:hypothetical protein
MTTRMSGNAVETLGSWRRWRPARPRVCRRPSRIEFAPQPARRDPEGLATLVELPEGDHFEDRRLDRWSGAWHRIPCPMAVARAVAIGADDPGQSG